MEGLRIHALEMNKAEFAKLSEPSYTALDRENGFMRALGRLQLLRSYNIIDQDFYTQQKEKFSAEVKRLDALDAEKDIDRKFRIFAWSRSGTKAEPYTGADGMFFLARDPAFRAILPLYHNKCEELGANEGQLESLRLLIQRVEKYALEHPSKLPDADPAKEPHLFK